MPCYQWSWHENKDHLDHHLEALLLSFRLLFDRFDSVEKLLTGVIFQVLGALSGRMRG